MNDHAMPATGDTTARIAVDIGGTFTDVVLECGDALTTTKVLTTPGAPDDAVLAGVVIKINISVSSDFTSGPVEVRSADYPRAAIEQIAHNAIMHRSYDRSNTPVRFHWFSDRVVIQSPGEFYGSVSPANIDMGVTAYRNPLIAEIMFHFGFAQRFGVGLRIARDAMEANGNPPMGFNFAPTFVNVTLRSAR